jgi:hypothetical protein
MEQKTCKRAGGVSSKPLAMTIAFGHRRAERDRR